MPIFYSRDRQLIYYRKIGRGIPVLMLHGVGMDSRHWLPFILPHIHRFQFYLPDFRGAGRSSHVPVNQADLFQNLTEDIDDLVTHLALKDFILVGYSLGASVALHWHQAGGFSEVLRYLHIDQSPCIANQVDWAHGLLGDRQASFLALLDDVLQQLHPFRHLHALSDLPDPVIRDITPKMAEVLSVAAGNPAVVTLLRQAARVPRWFVGLLGEISLHNLQAYLASYAANPHDYRESLTRFAVPVTMFIGKQSPLYGYEGQTFAASLIPHCQVQVFEKSGHLPQADEPVRFARALGRFLRNE
ncbi:MAG: alpha/beta hydrolase [Hahellaceae bacterium]|nr:alpha/beta hydrolase [Hahellaceae bacterium]MCP5170079.1 alpha/beta hydrolase [Hahellaceae bacterium]